MEGLLRRKTNKQLIIQMNKIENKLTDFDKRFDSFHLAIQHMYGEQGTTSKKLTNTTLNLSYNCWKIR